MEVIALIIPFVAIAVISIMADRLTMVLQAIMNRIPKLPDKFEWWIAYFIVLGISYLVCMEGNFDLFLYFNMQFRYPWEGWILTALVLSGGSSFVKTQFTMIDSIPGVISGVTTTIKNIVVSNNKKNADQDVASNTSETITSDVSVSNETSYDSSRFTDDI
ncbi:hypothetical protein D3C87_76360 [compost metagenome]